MATFATIVLVGLRDRVSGHVATGKGEEEMWHLERMDVKLL